MAMPETAVVWNNGKFCLFLFFFFFFLSCLIVYKNTSFFLLRIHEQVGLLIG